MRVYLDNAATTPLDPRVLEAMLPFFGERFGNPSSRSHAWGWEAEEAVEQAREEVARMIGGAPRELVFTSGATEAANLALKGLLAGRGPEAHLITTAVEHSAVLDPSATLEAAGLAVTRLRSDSEGRIDPADLESALRPETALVAVVHGNNEIGTLQDLAHLGAVCRGRGVLFFVDATQSAGKVPIDLASLPVDLLALSAHKLHGPKGAGALWMRRGKGAPRLRPLLDGGGQERGLRSGTLNVPAIVGFGKACAIARCDRAAEAARIAGLRDRLEAGIHASLEGVTRNGSVDDRLPGISNLHFEDVEAEPLLLELRGIALSTGSACASASPRPSHVLEAIGRTAETARNSIRFSFGRFNTSEEADFVIEAVIGAVRRLRSASRSAGLR